MVKRLGEIASPVFFNDAIFSKNENRFQTDTKTKGFENKIPKKFSSTMPYHLPIFIDLEDTIHRFWELITTQQ